MKAGGKAGLVAAALATISICGAATTAAGAAVAPGFFGMTPSGTTLADANQMAAHGVRTVRVQVNWGFIEPSPGQRDWSFYDDFISNLAAARLQALPVLLGVPTWISPHGSRPPIYSASQRSAWTSFVRELAARYGPNGSFWRERPGLPYHPLVDWEVWNEPNLRVYWGGRPNPRRYVRLLLLTRAALNPVDPSARLVLGGIFPPPRPRYGISQRTFLERLYRVRGARRTFDALAIHPFAARPKGVIAACREARRLMNRHRDRRTPLWITELGWSTGGANWGKSPFRATESTQAKFLRRSFRSLIARRRALRLQRLIWHAWQDSNVPGAPWTLNMGLLRSDGSPKPSLFAYSGLAR
jgi:Beta-galactosidase